MAILIPQDKMFIPYVATAGQTTFAYTWPMYADSDLTIYKITTTGVISTLVLTTDYTVTGVGTQLGGNVVLNVGALVGENIIVTGNLPESRSSNYTAAGDFTKESINESFNKVIQIAQQQRRDVDRSIHMNPADPLQIDGVGAIDMKLPLLADRANKYLGFDANGSVQMNDASGVAGPTSSVDNEVALFSGTTGQTLKRPSTASMIIPQGTTAQRDVPTAITLRGNTDGTEDVEAYINGGWQSLLTGGTGAPIGATYITQTPSGTLTSEQAMSALATGIVKNTTATGVQSIAVEGTDYYGPAGTDIPVTDGGTGSSTAGGARTNLGLVIGTDVQAQDATLQSISALGTAADKYAYTTGIDTWAEGDITAFGRSLIDDAAATNARTTLGLGSADNVSFLNGDFTGTEALKIPVGTTAQRPGAPADGDMRVNTTVATTEVYRNAAWRDIEAGSAGAGKVLQIQQTTKTDTFSLTTAATWTNVTGLSVTITPTATTSTILVMASVGIGGSTANTAAMCKVVRGATDIFRGDAASARTRAAIETYSATPNQMNTGTIIFEDSPATTSATTYNVQLFTHDGSGVYINRSAGDSDLAYVIRGVSSITVMEIGV